jgi:hypothetical protein
MHSLSGKKAQKIPLNAEKLLAKWAFIVEL